MKKLMVWVMLLCMAMGTACGEGLPQAAVELAQRIDVLAENDAFLEVMFGSDKLADKVREIADGEHGQQYTMMVNVDLTGAVASMMESLAVDVEISDPIVSEEIAKRLETAILFQAIAAQGAETMAIANSITAGTMFATDEKPGEGIYLIFYGEHTPVAVTWAVENGAASLSAMFVPVPELQACTTLQQVVEWLASIGAEGAMVTAVE